MCSGRTKIDDTLRALLDAARAVSADCQQNPGQCSTENNPGAVPYYLWFSVGPHKAEEVRLEVTDLYLQTRPAGAELLRLVLAIYADVKPEMWCN